MCVSSSSPQCVQSIDIYSDRLLLHRTEAIFLKFLFLSSKIYIILIDKFLFTIVFIHRTENCIYRIKSVLFKKKKNYLSDYLIFELLFLGD